MKENEELILLTLKERLEQGLHVSLVKRCSDRY